MRIVPLYYLEIFSFILSLAYYKYIKDYRLQPIVFLLMAVCITELTAGNYFVLGLKNNYIIYNYAELCFTPLTLGLFFQMLQYQGKKKQIFIGASILIMAFIMVNFLFIQGQQLFNTYSLILTKFATVMLALLVISKLFRDDDTAVMLHDNPYFWISGGWLIFGIGAMVVLGLQHFIAANKIQINGKNIYRIIMPVINVFLYGSYCYAFLLCRKLTKRSLQS